MCTFAPECFLALLCLYGFDLKGKGSKDIFKP